MTNLMEQARQGDPKAIAALMNRSTEPKGISVKASRDGTCLQVLLEGKSVPARDATLSFVRQGMANLGITSITTVKVFGRQVGQDTPVWQEEINLDDEAATAAPPMAMPMNAPLDQLDDEEDLLPDDPLDDFYQDDAPNSLDDGAYFDEDDYSDSTPSDVPHLPNESITDFVDDDDDPNAYDEDLADDQFDADDAIESQESPAKPAKQSSSLLLALLTFLALLLGGYYIYSQKPEVLTSLPVVGELIPMLGNGDAPIAETPAGTPDATGASPAKAPDPNAGSPVGDAASPPPAPASENAAPAKPPAPAPAPTPAASPAPPSATAPEKAPEQAPKPAPAATADPFREAVNAATKAAQLTQSASTATEWAEIATLWETAIEQMAAVPSTSPNYQTAQDRLGSYPANRDYARQQAGQ